MWPGSYMYFHGVSGQISRPKSKERQKAICRTLFLPFFASLSFWEVCAVSSTVPSFFSSKGSAGSLPFGDIKGLDDDRLRSGGGVGGHSSTARSLSLPPSNFITTTKKMSKLLWKMTNGKVDQSTEKVSLVTPYSRASISFKGKFRAQIYTCKMWVVWGRLPVKVIYFNKAIKHSSSINLSHNNYVYIIEQYQKRESIHVGHCLFVKIICKPMCVLAACLHSTACINTVWE